MTPHVSRPVGCLLYLQPPLRGGIPCRHMPPYPRPALVLPDVLELVSQLLYLRPSAGRALVLLHVPRLVSRLFYLRPLAWWALVSPSVLDLWLACTLPLL
jgi:hypothetical protein